jgi:hypothetical protein
MLEDDIDDVVEDGNNDLEKVTDFILTLVDWAIIHRIYYFGFLTRDNAHFMVSTKEHEGNCTPSVPLDNERIVLLVMMPSFEEWWILNKSLVRILTGINMITIWQTSESA